MNETMNYKNFEDKVYDDDLKIIDKGFRRDEAIALVEKSVPGMNKKEYIVAFNYTVDEKNNKLSWGYGYYYASDKETATKDYKRVISGGNLVNTFDKGQER